MDESRRRLLLRTLFGGGLLGLRALATGVPLAVLANPRKALAQTCTPTVPAQGQYIIYASSANGDPLNANVPGMYSDPGIAHPLQASMAPTAMTLSGKPTVGAAPWAGLAQSVLDRTVFFHHGTYTVVHPDMTKVMSLEGKVTQVVNGATQKEMLLSFLSKNLAPGLCTVQSEPITLGPRSTSETVTVGGRPQPIINPTSLASLLGNPTGVLGTLTALRDTHLDQLNAWFKQNGNSAQRSFLDRYATSQQQVRSISQSLLSSLSTIKDNGQDSQATAALTLIRMNVTPVVGIHLAFGGDNHTDTALAGEATQQVAGVLSISKLMDQLVSAGMQDKVTFLTLNVFGRTLSVKSGAANGRNHLGDHHVMVAIGKGFKGAVVGGVEPRSNDYRATSIDSATGNGVVNGGGDIPFTQTLQSVGKTLGVGVGVPAATMTSSIVEGKILSSVLA
jgi:hypothetical protein